jgi:hypothetical protein
VKINIRIPPPGARRRKRKLWGWGVLPLLAAALFAFLAFRAHYPVVSGAQPPRQEVAGAYHVHSTQSDGRLSPEQVAHAAAQVGLDFVVMTDHNVEALPAPRFVAGVLLVPGEELTTPNGHLVALGTSRALTADERAHDAIAHVAALGGFSILAHPVQTKNPWRDWSAAAKADGLELYSADTMLREALHHPLSRLFPAGVSWLLNPVHALMLASAAQPDTVAHLLALSKDAPKIALCATDAHGLPRPAEVSYESEFKAFVMHLPSVQRPLSPDPAVASQAVLAGLRSGQGYCGFDAIAPAAGFRIGAGAREVKVGDRAALTLPAVLPPTQVRISGPATLEPDGHTVRFTGTGPVELEIWARAPGLFGGSVWRPWIIPAPLLVKAADAQAATR